VPPVGASPASQSYAANPNEWDTGVPDGLSRLDHQRLTFVGGTGLGPSGQPAVPSTTSSCSTTASEIHRERSVFSMTMGSTSRQSERDRWDEQGRRGGLFHLDTDNFDGFRFTNNCVVNGTTGTGFFVDGNRNVTRARGARTPLFSGNFIATTARGSNSAAGMGDGRSPATPSATTSSMVAGRPERLAHDPAAHQPEHFRQQWS